MPAENWPIATPVVAMLDRVRLRAKERRRHRRARQAVGAAALTVVMGTAAVALVTGPDAASRLRTVPADGSAPSDPSSPGDPSAPAAEGGAGRTGSSTGGTGGGGGAAQAAGRGAGSARPVPRNGAAAKPPAPTVPSAPVTTTTAPPPAPAGSREIAFERGNRVWLVHADGRGEGPLTADGGAGRRIREPHWAPDGRRLVAVDSRPDGTGSSIARLAVVDLEGNVEPLTAEGTLHSRPRWSPDGSRIVYAKAKPQVGWSAPDMDIWVVDADGTDNRRLTALDGNRAEWSPDGKRLLGTCSDGSGLCTVDVDGTDVRPVPNGSGIWDLAWSPDGQWLAFAGSDSNGPHVGTMRIDGIDRRVVLGGWQAVGLAWSPDGRTIVFAGFRSTEHCMYPTSEVDDNCPDTPTSQLWRVDADGTGLRALTTGNDYYPAWRPRR